MIQEFKKFAMKGNLIDMAVGIIIGAAVSDMVGSLVESVLMPVVGIFMGGVDFKGLAITVGDANIQYGAFVQALIDFLIIAFVIFMIVKMINRMKEQFADETVAKEEKAATPADVALLAEIRDLLKDGNGNRA